MVIVLLPKTSGDRSIISAAIVRLAYQRDTTMSSTIDRRPQQIADLDARTLMVTGGWHSAGIIFFLRVQPAIARKKIQGFH